VSHRRAQTGVRLDPALLKLLGEPLFQLIHQRCTEGLMKVETFFRCPDAAIAERKKPATISCLVCKNSSTPISSVFPKANCHADLVLHDQSVACWSKLVVRSGRRAASSMAEVNGMELQLKTQRQEIFKERMRCDRADVACIKPR
jgi:hypothetical protein